MSVRLHAGALAALAKDAQTHVVLSQVAEDVAARARSQHIEVGGENFSPDEYPLPVEVQDGAGGPFVVLAHPAGIAVQAKHGTLTKAAAAEGLELRGDR